MTDLEAARARIAALTEEQRRLRWRLREAGKTQQRLETDLYQALAALADALERLANLAGEEEA